METIKSRDNRHARELAALLGSKKERRDAGLFVCEGLRLCLDAAGRAPVRKLLVTPGALARTPAVRDLQGCAGEMVVLEDGLAARIAGTKSTQGIFCICEMLDNSDSAVTIIPSGKFLLLSGLQDPGNMGACIRSAGALGLSGVFLQDCVELYSPKTLRASMGAVFYTPIRICGEMEGVVDSLRDIGVRVYAAALSREALPVQAVDFSGGCAVLVGNEGNGLTAGQVAACDGSIVIPMAREADSLNAAAAASILMWEMTRREGPAAYGNGKK